jgi:hypothetical protein
MTAVKNLSLDQATALCTEWVPIGGQVYESATHLQEADFAAFRPHWEFDESFCADPGEVEDHRIYVRERGKERFGTPFPFPVTPEERQRFYRSAFNQALRAQNERLNEGASLAQAMEKFPGEIWRQEIDPCARSRVYAMMRDKATYTPRMDAFKAVHKQAVQDETERHKTGLAAKFDFTVRDRLRFYLEVMQRDAGELGFSHDARKSEDTFPVFSRPINSDWDSCLTLEDPQVLGMTRKSGSISVRLELRQRTFEGESSGADPGQLLFVPYNRVIPGFCYAYRNFSSLDELELSVRAHLCLLRTHLAAIEDAARGHLSTV